MSMRYVKSQRHTIHLDYLDYMDELSVMGGNFPDVCKYTVADYCKLTMLSNWALKYFQTSSCLYALSQS